MVEFEWLNALINWYEGKPAGRNTTNQYWEHDIEAWIKQKFPNDHSTWQQLAKDFDKWTKWRDEYAADWPNKPRSITATNTSVNHRITHRAATDIKTKKASQEGRDRTEKVTPSVHKLQNRVRRVGK